MSCYGFHSDKKVKAVRKARPCSTCHQMIQVGETAIDYSGLTDGYFHHATMHPECRDAEVAWNHAFGSDCDEWSTLDDVIYEDDGEWLRKKYPIVAARMLPPLPENAHGND